MYVGCATDAVTHLCVAHPHHWSALNIKKIKKAHDSVRNQKMLSGLARGFEKTMTIATDMMVKIAKAQNPTAEPDVKTKKYKRRKAKPKQDEKPKEKEPPFGDMSKFWKS